MRIKVFVVALLALMIPLFVFATTASAQTFRTGQSSTVASGETIDGSAYIAGASVDVSGTINGDLYCAGQNVTISGTVNGDILCFGQTVSFSGATNGNIRVAGQTVTISGTVAKSASIAGQAITVESKGKIGQDATTVGQDININGQITRDLVLSSASGAIDSEIGRNVNANVETLSLAKGAAIGGDLNYSSPNKLTKTDGAEVTGKTTYTETKYESAQPSKRYDFAGTVVWSLMLIVSAVILALLFPRLFHTATNSSASSVPQALLAILVGFVAVIVMPIAIIVMMVTILGVPLAIVTLLAWILILALSGAFTAYYVGRVIWRSQTHAVLVMLAGSAVLVVLLAIPIVNISVGLVSLWYGSGVILLQLQNRFETPRYTMKKSPVKSK